MKISLICLGKTDEQYLLTGIEKYLQRLKHYVSFQLIILPDIKNTKHLTQEQQKEKESVLLLKSLAAGDTLVLLDERGAEMSSTAFSAYLEKQMVSSVHHLVFFIGGPYGFDDQVYKRANGQLSLSKMTFSHQMIRLFFVEQLYRAFTILKNEPYHHA